MQDKQYPHTCDVYSLSKYIQTSDERGCFPIAFREIYQISNTRIKATLSSINYVCPNLLSQDFAKLQKSLLIIKLKTGILLCGTFFDKYLFLGG